MILTYQPYQFTAEKHSLRRTQSHCTVAVVYLTSTLGRLEWVVTGSTVLEDWISVTYVLTRVSTLTVK